jgi:membrane protein
LSGPPTWPGRQLPRPLGTNKDSATDRARGTLRRLDSYQQRHPALGVPIAVIPKFVEDESTSLASQIAFWAFFSVFPLLLVFVTLLGYFLPPKPQGDMLGQAASFFPLLAAPAAVLADHIPVSAHRRED